MRIPHLSRYLVILPAAAVAVAGCSGSHHNRSTHAARTPSSSTTTTAPGPTTTSTAAASPTVSGSGQGVTTTTANPNASAVPGGCTPSQLGVILANNGVAAGSVVYQINFHNNSSQSCSLTGYPGIGLLDASGHLLPLTLGRSPQNPPTPVPLAPGADANFSFRYSDGTGYATPSCTRAAKMEVTPPNDYTSIVINAQPSPCGPPGQAPQAQVTAVAPGAA